MKVKENVMKIKKLFFSVVACLLSTPVLAYYPIHSYKKHQGIGDIAGHFVTGPMQIIMKFMDDACYLTGIILLVVGFTKYLRHRRNPQEVPISTPIMYFILAIVNSFLQIFLSFGLYESGIITSISTFLVLASKMSWKNSSSIVSSGLENNILMDLLEFVNNSVILTLTSPLRIQIGVVSISFSFP